MTSLSEASGEKARACTRAPATGAAPTQSGPRCALRRSPEPNWRVSRRAKSVGLCRPLGELQNVRWGGKTVPRLDFYFLLSLFILFWLLSRGDPDLSERARRANVEDKPPKIHHHPPFVRSRLRRTIRGDLHPPGGAVCVGACGGVRMNGRCRCLTSKSPSHLYH